MSLKLEEIQGYLVPRCLQPSYPHGSPRGEGSTSNEDQEFILENRQEINSPENPPDEGPDMAAPISQPESALPSALSEKGTSSNILAHGDQLIVQSLTQMAMGDERPSSSEMTVSHSPSPAPKSPVLTSAPKWDGTPKSSRNQVRPPVTRSSSKKLMEDSLKESQQKTTRRRKLKRKMIVGDETPIQLENIFDHEETERERK
ncbi:hypothetical protein HAX54_038426 [Datura stramonium]|uniref:Uncharacterized protein n=1 Tax=Datura stramonium TaxID=4076 RepID=A0ABS8SHX2_DATST|nr:hypothetical protein [Datura stramonium]